MTPCPMDGTTGVAGEGVRFSDVLSTYDAFGGVGTPESSLWQRGVTLSLKGGTFVALLSVPPPAFSVYFHLFYLFPLDCFCYISNVYMYLFMFVVLSYWPSRKTLLGSKRQATNYLFFYCLHLYHRSFWLVSSLQQLILFFI